MRCMLKVSFPVETSNAHAKKGTLGPTIQKILADLKPEAAYFTAVDQKRGGYIFFDMTDTSQIPSIAEPWFLAFNAAVEIVPVMNAEDLGKGAAGIEQAAKKYGA
jgi:Domain of unknown function (DUF3303)